LISIHYAIVYCFGSPHVLTPVSRQCLKLEHFHYVSVLRLVLTKSETSRLVSCLDTSVLANVSVSEKMYWLHRYAILQIYRMILESNCIIASKMRFQQSRCAIDIVRHIPCPCIANIENSFPNYVVYVYLKQA